MHACQLSIVGFSKEHIEWLALVNERSSVSCHVYESPLGNFPNCLVQWLKIIWDLVNVLEDYKGKVSQSKVVLQLYRESALTRHGGKICMSGRNSKRNTVKIIVMKTYHQNLQHWTLNRKINSEFSPTFNNFLSRWQQLTDHRDPFVLLKTYILTFLIRIKIKSTWMEPLAATSLFFNVSFHKSLSVKSFSRWWFTIYKWKTFTCMR